MLVYLLIICGNGEVIMNFVYKVILKDKGVRILISFERGGTEINDKWIINKIGNYH